MTVSDILNRALVTTFATTPLVLWIYPTTYQRKVEAWRRGEVNWDGTRVVGDAVKDIHKPTGISRITVLLRLDSLSSLLSLLNLLKEQQTQSPILVHQAKESLKLEHEVPPSDLSMPVNRLEVHGLRLVEVGERNSSVMRVAEEYEFSERDPIISIFRSFARLCNFACSAALSLVPENAFAEVLADKSKDTFSDMLIVPWSKNGSLRDDFNDKNNDQEQRFASGPHNSFILSILEVSKCDTAIFINRGLGGFSPEKTLTRKSSGLSVISRVPTGITEHKPFLPVLDISHHVFFPFIGGMDDRGALHFVLQLIKNVNITATVVHVINNQVERITVTTKTDVSEEHPAIKGNSTMRGSIGSNIEEQDHAFYMQLAESLPRECSQRIVFETLETNQPLPTIIKRLKEEFGQKPKNAGDLVVVGRSHGEVSQHLRDDVGDLFHSHSSIVGLDTRKALGEVGEAVLAANVRASILVFKAASTGSI